MCDAAALPQLHTQRKRKQTAEAAMQPVTGRIDQLRATQARVHDGLEQLVPRHEAASTLRGLRDHDETTPRTAPDSTLIRVRLVGSSAADSVVTVSRRQGKLHFGTLRTWGRVNWVACISW